jgi:hypothetical protein
MDRNQTRRADRRETDRSQAPQEPDAPSPLLAEARGWARAARRAQEGIATELDAIQELSRRRNASGQ